MNDFAAVKKHVQDYVAGKLEDPYDAPSLKQLDMLLRHIEKLEGALAPFAHAFEQARVVEEYSPAIRAATGLVSYHIEIAKNVAAAKVSYATWRFARDAYFGGAE